VQQLQSVGTVPPELELFEEPEPELMLAVDVEVEPELFEELEPVLVLILVLWLEPELEPELEPDELELEPDELELEPELESVLEELGHGGQALRASVSGVVLVNVAVPTPTAVAAGIP
jgi:hypothetical protein